VVTPTLPGFHPEPPDKSLKTLEDFALCLSPIIEKQPRPRTVLGTGIGGSILLELLQHQPNIADQLLFHAPVGAHLDRRLFPKILKLPGVARCARALIGLPLLRPLWTRLFFESPLPEDFLHQFFLGYRDCRVFGKMFHLIDHRWWRSLSPVETPASILWGARERLLTVDQKDPFLKILPHATTRVLPHWRHFPMIEQPEEFVKIVEEYL